MIFDPHENKLIESERKVNALEIQNDNLDRHTKELLAECNVSEEQLSAFISNADNFSPENWQQLHEEKKKIESKLATDLANITSPLQVKKNREARNTPPHWLFVR